VLGATPREFESRILRHAVLRRCEAVEFRSCCASISWPLFRLSCGTETGQKTARRTRSGGARTRSARPQRAEAGQRLWLSLCLIHPLCATVQGSARVWPAKSIEIGFGPGHNVLFYPAAVTRVATAEMHDAEACSRNSRQPSNLAFSASGTKVASVRPSRGRTELESERTDRGSIEMRQSLAASSGEKLQFSHHG